MNPCTGNHYETMNKPISRDFQGIGYSKSGHFKEVRKKIKELEQLNIELSRRHKRLEAIFNGMSDGLAILDRDFTIVFANDVQQRFFPNVPLVGKKCFNAYFRRERICSDCPARRTLESHETLQGEVLIKSGEFAGRYFEWTSSPIIGPSDTVDEIIFLMRDVTRRKEYEHKLREADRMAAIGFLAAGIAHEINNPLTSIVGFSEGLIKRFKKIQDAIDEPTLAAFKEYLNVILSDAYRCRDIIGNLQAFSRSSSDKFESLEIDRIVQDTLSLFRQHAKDCRIEMTFENRLCLGLNSISGKSSQLKHLFLNILNRAFQSMENGGKILVKAINRENRIEVILAYSGGGIARHPHDTIYSPPNMGGDQDQEYTIDLAISYNIVQHHKGTLQFSVDADNSDIVTLNFPLSIP